MSGRRVVPRRRGGKNGGRDERAGGMVGKGGVATGEGCGSARVGRLDMHGFVVHGRCRDAAAALGGTPIQMRGLRVLGVDGLRSGGGSGGV